MLKLKSVPGAISGTLQTDATQKTHEKKHDSDALLNAEIEERTGCNFWHSPGRCDTKNKRKKNALATPFSMLKLKSVPSAAFGTLQEDATQKTYRKKTRLACHKNITWAHTAKLCCARTQHESVT